TLRRWRHSSSSLFPYTTLFRSEFDKLSNGTTKLASPDIFATRALGEEINTTMSDAEVQKVIRKKVDESVESAFEVLRKRIDKFRSEEHTSELQSRENLVYRPLL